LNCRFYKREKEAKQNLCMAEIAILGEAGDPCNLSDDEVFDYCVPEDCKNCHRFQWVERKKDKAVLRNHY